MTINDVQPEDAGIYFCLAHTNSGHSVGTFHLTVLQKSAVILQEPKNVTLEEGGSAYFTCKSHEKLSTDSTSWVKLEDRFDEGFTVLSEGKDLSRVKASFESVPPQPYFEFPATFWHWLAQRFQNEFGEERF